MRREGRQLLRLMIVITSVVFAACAASPPPKPMTREEFLANRERMIDQAVREVALAGGDPTAAYEHMELLACYHDAMALPDAAQRSPAVQRCRVTWPQPSAPAPAVTTKCYTQNGYTQCSSQ
jgi:hypothetical protein